MLVGRTILLPRDPERAQAYVQALEAAGAQVVVEAVTRVEPGAGAELHAAFHGLAAGAYDWLVAASGQVAQVLPATPALGATQVAAIGPATAQALRARGWPVHLVAEGNGAQALTTALAPQLTPASRILLPRAASGRAELGEGLRATGAQVDEVTAYRTVPRPAAELAPLVRDLAAGRFHGVIFFAPSQVAALCAAFASPAEAAHTLSALPLRAAIGPTTAAAMLSAGLPAQVTAESPTAAALMDALGQAG